MGQDISLPLSGIPNSTTIYTKTQPTIDIMNKVLDFILKNADYRDMIALANEKECAKWIIIAESKLKTLFIKIKVQPQFDNKTGILYLKKIDTLKQNNDILGCKLLAVFFIRLFQVVGALSLSIMDTKIPDRMDYLVTAESKIPERKGVPFFKPIEERQKFLGLFGGALSEDELKKIDRSLHMFRLYLISNNDTTYSLNRYSTKERDKKIDSIKIDGYIVKLQNDGLLFDYNSGSFSVDFKIVLKGSSFILDVDKRNNKAYPYNRSFGFEKKTDNTIVVEIDKRNSLDFAEFIVWFTNMVTKLPPSQTLKILEELNYLEPSHVQPYYRRIKDVEFGPNSGIFVSSKEEYDSETPRFVFACPIKNNHLIVSFELLIVKSIIKGLDAYTVEIINLKNESSEKLKFTADFNYKELSELNNSNSDDENKTNKKTERVFTTKEGIGKIRGSNPTHGKQTIQRWLQLMFSIIKEEAEEVVESGPIETKQGYLRAVPDASIDSNYSKLYTEQLWKNLTRSPPVKSFCTARALQLLNISGLQNILPKEIRPLIYNTSFDLVKDGSLPTPGQSIKTSAGIRALNSLYDDFTDIYDSKTNSKNDKKPLGQIIINSFVENEELRSTIKKLEDIKEETGTKVGLIDVKTSRSKVDELRNQARILFQTQFNHTSKVNTLLQKIFVFSEPITLNSNILAKGIKGIEEIAVEARELLTEYYSNCQIEYSKGVSILTKPKVVPGPAKA